MSEIISQTAWEWLKEQENFQTADLAIHLGLTKEKTKTILQHLNRKGLIETLNTSMKPYLYAPVKSAVPNFSRGNSLPPIKNGRLLIWRAMRWQCEFSNASIAASTRQKSSSINLYIRILVAHDYVRVTRKPGACKKGLYRLVTYTGPKNPQMKKGGLYDQNLSKFIPKIKDKS
jgi:hypothetical protein